MLLTVDARVISAGCLLNLMLGFVVGLIPSLIAIVGTQHAARNRIATMRDRFGAALIESAF